LSTSLSPSLRESAFGAVSDRRVADDIYADSCLLIEQKRYYLAIKGSQVKLTKTEFRIASCLASNMNGITRLDDLWNFAWDRAKPINRKSIQVMMSRLRSKLAARGLRIDGIIEVGYILTHGDCCTGKASIRQLLIPVACILAQFLSST
jgi:DNA-binding response OmpR family regulator